MKMKTFYLVICAIVLVSCSYGDPRRSGRYLPPKPQFEVFNPQGLIVWINADPGISSFTFHGKLNEQFLQNYDVGRWAQTITKVKNGRYLFIDRDAKIMAGDTIFYRTVIIRNGQTYRTNSGSYTIQTLRPASTSTPASTTFITQRSASFEATDSRTRTLPIERRTKDVRSAATQTENEDHLKVNCQVAHTLLENGKRVCVGQLLFEDHFDGVAIDERKWRIENRFASDPDNEFVVYADFKDNLNQLNGQLTIRPTLFEEKFGPGSTSKQFRFADECTGDRSSRDCIRDTKIDFDMIPPVLTAQITTVNSFRFTYGRVVVRAKLPQGNWIFPQLYLIPATHFYGRDGYASGLMRIAYVPGGPLRFTNQLSGGLIVSDSDPLRCSNMCTLKRNIQWNADFHEFGIKWTPDGVWMDVDGEVYCMINPEDGLYHGIQASKPHIANLWKLSGTRMAPFDRDFYIGLGVAVGGHYDFHQFSTKPWKDLGVKAMYTFWTARDSWYSTWNDNATLHVDFIRIFAV